MLTVGFLVNPVAGMGGSVGLKGTDDAMYERALELGAAPVSPGRSEDFLRAIRDPGRLTLLAAPDAMGEREVTEAGLPCRVVGSLDGPSSAADTRRIAGEMVQAGADIIVFAGGDGTARDVFDAVGVRVPVIGIPSGVKIYSAAFAYSPRAAAALLDAFSEDAELREEEVLDIDEDAFRQGRVIAKHYGFLLVPADSTLVQRGKSAAGASREVLEELALAAIDEFEPGVLYLLGSGTTLRAVGDALGIQKTLLGIDAVLDGVLVGSDLNERAILELLDNHSRAAIVVTPLGGNGFLFGRGNKQLTPAVLRRVGTENVLVVAHRDKLLSLDALHVDTGDAELDATIAGYIDVLVGHGYRTTPFSARPTPSTVTA